MVKVCLKHLPGWHSPLICRLDPAAAYVVHFVQVRDYQTMCTLQIAQSLCGSTERRLGTNHVVMLESEQICVTRNGNDVTTHIPKAVSIYVRYS